MRNIKCAMECQYNGHNIKPNGDIDVNFKIPYDQITSGLMLIQMLNTNIHVYAKVDANKPVELGHFMLKNVNIDRDGEMKIKFNSEVDAVIMDNINQLTQPEVIVKIKCDANVDDEE